MIINTMLPYKKYLFGLAVTALLGTVAFKGARKYFDKESREFCLKNQIYEVDETNAVAHCYVSYKLTKTFGTGFAKFLANMNETIEGLFSKKTSTDAEDTWKDQWNNKVGRDIGAFEKELSKQATYKVPEKCFERVIIACVKDSTLIVSPSDKRIELNRTPKPNIPLIESYKSSVFKF